MQFEAELKNPETSQFQRLAALQFVLNLVGDISDPLNAIDRGDQGGHCTALQIGSKPPVRLSTYWEETLVREAAGGNAAQGAARVAAVLPADARSWSEGNPEAWARDSFEIAKTVTYGFGSERAVTVRIPGARRGRPSRARRWRFTRSVPNTRRRRSPRSRRSSPRPGCASPACCATASNSPTQQQ